ncbi:MAG: valine--tRNA ligase [Gammaproteobacteria bacterium]|nr:valine--tRNA ligase [Gammaproteobacteria bacterium]
MTETEISKTYHPGDLEQDIYQQWEDADLFAPRGNGKPYCIVIPPPNVTGSLHMGHAFQDTVMDILVRYHRMLGDRTLWQAGTDHAGIATQMVVERQLEEEGRTRHDIGREAFVERVWEWKNQSGGTITRQLRRMGASLDWSRERFTMDEGLSHAVQEVFIRLYEEDLIYRGKRLVNWDPHLHTAVSDLEVASEEENGHLWHFRYPLADRPDEYVTVATTRPETMLGDTAVAVHPDDDRYRHLVGRSVVLPLVEREIPVIADDYVDPEFGSGCVKITPAHDFNDYEVGRRHNLPMINVLTVDAAIELPDTPYHGLDRFEARRRVVRDLEARGLVTDTEEHRHTVPRGDRSGVVIEPYLTNQWFVRAGPLAEASIRAVEDGRIRFVPDNWRHTFYEWMYNIQDWCISRQIWWGHRVPAWYDADGNIFVARDARQAREQARQHHGRDAELRRDEDVLDTWFSSALWPFSTLGWPDRTDALKTFYPTSVLVTGFDIIFFWVARMIMFGLKFMDEVPFHEVYVHGLVRDGHGQKMSKSKGNILDPLDLIDGIDTETLVGKRTTGLMQPKMAQAIAEATRQEFPDGISAHGTDALRFTFASLATTGRNINFDLGRIGGYRNFCNKLWNAARYVLINTRETDCGGDWINGADLCAADRWIIARLQQVTGEVREAIDSYRFDNMARALHGFLWDEYCSWYLELNKVVLNDPDTPDAEKLATRQTMVHVLEASLRLLHPAMPFITEALWRKLAPVAGIDAPSIMIRPFPEVRESLIDDAALTEMAWVQAVISAVRNIRGEMNIDPSQAVPVLLKDATRLEKTYLGNNREFLMRFGRFKSLDVVSDERRIGSSATALVGDVTVLVPLGEVIDKQVELGRLRKEYDQMGRDFQRTRGKLDNDDFVRKAPQEVVDKERVRLEELTRSMEKLESRMEKIAALPD